MTKVTLFKGTARYTQAIRSAHGSLQVLNTIVPLYFQTNEEMSSIRRIALDALHYEEDAVLPYIEKGRKREIDKHLKEKLQASISLLNDNLQTAENYLKELIKVLRAKEYDKEAVSQLGFTLKRFTGSYLSLNKIESGIEARPEKLHLAEIGKIKADVDFYSNVTTDLILKTLLSQYS